MFQRILNFVLGNPILIIIILGGLFNAAVRIAQKTKEQRAKREAFNQIARQQQEAMRTGRQTPAPRSSQQQQPKEPNSERRQRIEALRQERMEQLRALREKRSGASAAAGSPSSVSQSHPNLPPIPVQTQPSRPSQQPSPQARRAQRPPQQSRPTPPQSPRRSGAQPGQQSRPQVRQQVRPQARTSGASSGRPKTVATSSQAPSVRRKRSTQSASSAADQPRQQKNIAGQITKGPIEEARKRSSISNARSMLRSRASVRQAILLSEILDAPIALRDQDIASGSLMS